MSPPGPVDILILREAAQVRRLRMPAWLLRALWIGPLALLLGLAAVLVVASGLRRDNARLADRDASLTREIAAAGERLARLEAVERVLAKQDLAELETLIGSYSPDNPGWWKGRPEERKPEPRDKAEAARERPDLTRLLARIDANQAGIDNLRMRIENRRLLLNFDLSNVTPQTNLVGRAEAALVGNDASLTPLKPEKDELSFQIQRFKQIATSLPLPAKLEARDIYGLRLVIVDPSGKTVFSQVYPLPKE